MSRESYLRAKIRHRFLFALVAGLLYFALALNYVGEGGLFRIILPGTAIPLPIALYAGTIIVLLLLELLFLYRARRLEAELRGRERR